MAGQRKALIIANDTYEQEALGDLLAPAADAEALGRVLGDPKIGDFAVQVVHNEPAHIIQAHIEEMFSESRPDDLLLLHFSGHGLKSESGELFFAALNTRPNRLGSTAVPADFVQRCIRTSRSRSVVLLLDCCYGGAFAQGVRVRAAGDINVLDSFPQGRSGGGRGRAVITASSAMEFAFEGARLGDDQRRRPSVFTAALVEGLETGEADRDEDGWVSLDELYDYLFDKVREQNPHQTPSRQFELEGELYLARSRRRRIRSAPIPADLRSALADPNMYTRLGAIGELRTRLAGDNLPAAAGACEALAELVCTDIGYVAEAAASALKEAAPRPDQAELYFGAVVQGSAPPHHRIQLLGPPIARACEPRPSADWIHVAQTATGLDISIDTLGTGTLHGSVGLKGLAGETAIAIGIDFVSPPRQTSAVSSSGGLTGQAGPHPTTRTRPAEGLPTRQGWHVSEPTAKPQAGEQASREPQRSSPVTALNLDGDSRPAPLGGLAAAEGSDDRVNTDLQPNGPPPGTNGLRSQRPERKRSPLRSPLLLAAVLVGLASVAVLAAVLLTRAPRAQPVTSAVSYRFAAEQYADGLVAVRRWTLTGRNGSLFTETITVSSASSKTLLVPFEEPIPAAITSNIHMVRFIPRPSTIVNADPVVEWKIRVPAHGTVTFGYQVAVAPSGATTARLTRWVKDFDTLAATLKIGPVQIQSLRVSPQAIRIAPGQTVQLTLNGLMSDGTSADRAVLAGVVWRTGNPAVATVSSLGVVTGNRPGETRVAAQIGDIRATITITVTSPTGPFTPNPASSTTTATTTIPTPTPSPTPSPTPTPAPSLP